MSRADYEREGIAPAGAGHSDKAREEIEEMAKVYDAARLKARETLGSMNEGEAMWYSKAFYNTGYRKRKTSEWRITGDGGYGECANCGVAPFECDYPEDLRPGWAGYCSGCGAKMLGVNNGELLTWDQLSELRARKEAVSWAVYQGVCNYCDHSQKCSKYYEDQFPPDTPCMMKKRDFLEGGVE